MKSFTLTSIILLQGPVTLEENEYIVNFAKALNSCGYNRTVTIESAFSDFSNEINDAIIYLRKVFNNENNG